MWIEAVRTRPDFCLGCCLGKYGCSISMLHEHHLQAVHVCDLALRQGLAQCGTGLHSTASYSSAEPMRLNYNTALVGDKVELVPYRPEHVPVRH